MDHHYRLVGIIRPQAFRRPRSWCQGRVWHGVGITNHQKYPQTAPSDRTSHPSDRGIGNHRTSSDGQATPHGRYNPEGGDPWVGSNGKQWEAMATTPRVGINGWEAMGSNGHNSQGGD